MKDTKNGTKNGTNSNISLNSWLVRLLFGALKYKITENTFENEKTISFYVKYEKIFMCFFANKFMESMLTMILHLICPD